MSISTFKKSLYVSGIVLTLAAVGGTQFFELPKSHAEGEKQPAAAQAMPVSVAVVQPKLVTQWNEFSGRLEAVDAVEVRSRVVGAVQSIAFKEGAIVKQGDLLVKIDPAPYEAEVARARAQVSAAKPNSHLPRTSLNAASAVIPVWFRRAIMISVSMFRRARRPTLRRRRRCSRRQCSTLTTPIFARRSLAVSGVSKSPQAI